MKTTHWGRRPSGLSQGARWSAFALAFAFIFVLARLLAPNVFLYAFAPMFSFGNTLSVSVDGIFAGFSDARILAAKSAKLEGDNAALSLENRTLTEKVKDLATLLGSGSKEPASILAGVLARPPVAAYDTFILSVGTNAGVTEGMEAFGPGSVPLGVVSSVTTDFSRITLFSAPGVSTAAWIGASRTPVTLLGAGAGTYTVSVPRDVGIAVGDTVFLPGPGAIPVGTVVHVGGEASDPLATLFIHPVINPFSITWVSLRNVGSALKEPS